MMFKGRVAAYLASLLLPLLAAAQGTEIDQYLQSLGRIKSYDALIHVDQLVYPDAHKVDVVENAPIVGMWHTNRDVFAIGLGRRIERGVGDKALHEIGIIDWESGVGDGKPKPSSLSYVLPGLTYYEYLNPVIEKLFLADLLKAPNSSVRSIPAPFGDSSLVGFELRNSSLKGPVRFWLDSKHGYLPSKLEIYQRVKTETALANRLQVQSFTEPAPGIWVPLKATLESIIPVGPSVGRTYLGFAMTLDVNRSAWNSITDNRLFIAQGLPDLNHEERGWKYRYPPAVLPAVQKSAEIRRQVMGGSNRTTLYVAIGMALPLLVIGFFIVRKKLSQRPHLRVPSIS